MSNGLTWPLHSWSCISRGCPHKTEPLDSHRWMARNSGHPALPRETRAVGNCWKRGSHFVQECSHWQVTHTPVDSFISMLIWVAMIKPNGSPKKNKSSPKTWTWDGHLGGKEQRAERGECDRMHYMQVWNLKEQISIKQMGPFQCNNNLIKGLQGARQALFLLCHAETLHPSNASNNRTLPWR